LSKARDKQDEPSSIGTKNRLTFKSKSDTVRANRSYAMPTLPVLAAVAISLIAASPEFAYDPADYTTVNLPNGQVFTYLTAGGAPRIEYDPTTQIATVYLTNGSTLFYAANGTSSSTSGGGGIPEVIGGNIPPIEGGSRSAPIPEPEAFGLMGLGLAGLLAMNRRRRRRTAA
jgi:PEP-CTERM motif